MSSAGSLIAMGGSSAPPSSWPNQPRKPFLSFPAVTASQPPAPWASCWSNEPYLTVIPSGIVPDKPTLRFNRGNVMGVRVPGLPPVDGGSSDPNFLITWFLDRMPFDDAVRAIAFYHQVCGYTHLNLSIPQSIYNYGTSFADFCKIASACKSAGLWVIVNALDGSYPFSQVEPMLDSMFSQGLIDKLLGCWQVDQKYSPVAFWNDAVFPCANWANPKAMTVCWQWVNGACMWWDDETCAKLGICDRWSGQAYLSKTVLESEQWQQFDTEAPLGSMQSVKVLPSLPSNVHACVCEYDYQAEFDNPLTRLEPYGDLKGRALMATTNTSSQGQPGVTAGYMGGCRQALSDPNPGVVL